MIRPRYKLPLWAALAIPGAAYVVRSVVIRNGDFTPDLPQDVVAAAAFVIVLVVAGFVRSRRP